MVGVLTRSLAVQAALAAAPADEVASATRSGPTISGAVVSTTVIEVLAALVFPAASFAEQPTIVVPSGYDERMPLYVMTGVLTRSVAVQVTVAGAPSGPTASSVRGAGALSCGGGGSTTVIQGLAGL